jgi:hypothetical protein
MLNLDEVKREHTAHLDAFEREVKMVYSTLVLPNWDSELHHFPQTLYGYLMGLFARIDLLSAYWKGDAPAQGQTLRMIDFMDKYISPAPNREANSAAVQMWRHKLMHTSEPRYLLDEHTGKVYRWLLHWFEQLPRAQHYTFAETYDSKILNLGLVYLIEDLKKGLEKYLADLSASASLQSNYEKVQAQLASYKFKVYS